ncbi:uncharacterized protein LY79DRAFT_520711 [Colletotrichum navitas]|uniref:Uncharacterized protein n=1 Tax=Colletotrichum navitas TaxID=681940 RepID=A0AAD8V303_9PEZI|nr:uncharacterized protein LY79DRAFT_520711 [Colletotrichum navitas]KAK1580374.1 hypothetical protein LY79DRAFT_520711 [Colletotrichum navitas]
MRIPSLHPLTANLITSALILFSLTKMVTPIPTDISHVVDDADKPKHQNLTPAIQVPGIHPPQKRDERNCLGTYLCTEKDWKGDCYWACFRKGLEVQLETEWAPKIKSVRPDHDTKCKFFFGTECRTRHKSQDMVYPGGDFDAKKMGKLGVGCFYCL